MILVLAAKNRGFRYAAGKLYFAVFYDAVTNQVLQVPVSARQGEREYTARGHNLRFLLAPRSVPEKVSHFTARRQVRPQLRRSVMFIVSSLTWSSPGGAECLCGAAGHIPPLWGLTALGWTRL